ncbi:N-acetylmuramoyl-L-alanine amidase [Lentibacillus sp. JNUCC-1]|uniref:N-acetylmuramoyl-L-alanine amidase n=1 Tax=Lentibacillus sp. JNUCC-1 TaxID=2654513 RepID=UPI0012E7DDB1|nr:N-acetylmuramoyl-L-alanine amidase [Lentibacillus sp. JNUCC-1]MUV38924.1 N-acetylmuramoyl-L-alanine amidase [Lentibacillus sp. JNUCC-1]
MFKVFIDPGHGGSDPGATAFGVQEKDLTLKIARAVCEELIRNVPCRFKLSRTTDKTMSLKERTDMANQWGADLLVSIHINAGGGSGFESFIFNGRHKAQTSFYQTTIHQAILKHTSWTDRGQKQENFHMLRESRMSAVLTESGFIDHPDDVKKLKQAHFIQKIAAGHVSGIGQALSTQHTKPPQKNQATYTIQKGDTLWDIAQDNHTTLAHIFELNPGIDPYQLQIGQNIQIGSIKDTDQYHEIAPGDTLWSLSKTYHTTITVLLANNPGIKPQALKIGQQIKIR